METKDGKAEENWYDRDLSKEEICASNTGTLNRESYGTDASVVASNIDQLYLKQQTEKDNAAALYEEIERKSLDLKA